MERITAKRISFIIFLFVIFLVLYFSRSMIQPIFLSLVISYILSPLVKSISFRGINKRLAVLITLLILIGFTALTILFVIPGIIHDVLGILHNADEYRIKLDRYINDIGYDSMPVYLKNVTDKSILKIQGMIVGSLNTFFNELIDFSMELPTYILTPVFVYYFLIDSEYFIKIFKSLLPTRARGKSVELWHKIDFVLGSFVRSQLMLSLIISLMTFIALIILKIRYPIIIAFINGITNIIPYFGPIIGFVPAFLAALTQSFNKALLVAVAFLIIQQFESSVIAPKLMGDTMGIHPVFIMVIILLGGKYFGGWGLLLSVPIAGIVKVIISYIIKNLY